MHSSAAENSLPPIPARPAGNDEDTSRSTPRRKAPPRKSDASAPVSAAAAPPQADLDEPVVKTTRNQDTDLGAAGDDSRRWRSFAKRLADGPPRRPGRRLRRLLEGEAPVLWALPEQPTFDGTRALVRRLEKVQRQGLSKAAAIRIRSLASEWLGQEPLAADRPKWLLEAIAWAHALPQLAVRLEQRLWQQLLDQLLSMVRDGQALRVEEDPWSHQLVAELGATLSHTLAEVPECAGLGEGSREALSHGICELTDGEGLPHARHLHLLRPLLACLTRCLLLGGSAALAQEARLQYEWLVKQAVRWTRRDGSQVLADAGTTSWQPGLLAIALELAGDPASRFLAATQLPAHEAWADRHLCKLPKKNQPDAACISEWAAAASLRSDWSHSSPRLAARFAGRELAMELAVGQHVLISGACPPEVAVDGRRLQQTDDWELICQFTDADSQYLEIQCELEGGWRVQRQMFLGRTDGFMLIADAVLGTQSASIEYATRLPLANSTKFRTAHETHEGWLVHGEKVRALVLPLGLPEWRSERSVGGLETADGCLVLQQHQAGQALFCPLFFDLNWRKKHAYTWRRLTVGANRAIEPADVAVGFRVQISKRQWLVYRSLTPRASRSVLGQHFIHEFVLGRFTARGTLDELIQIE